MSKLWRCNVCGYIHKDNEAPETCPTCGAPKDKFLETIEIVEQTHINFNQKITYGEEVAVNPFFGDYEKLVAFVYNLPVGQLVPAHKHPTTDELFFVQKGKIEFIIGGKTFIATEGDVLQGKMDVPHSFKNIGDVHAAFLSVKGPKPVDVVFIEGE